MNKYYGIIKLISKQKKMKPSRFALAYYKTLLCIAVLILPLTLSAQNTYWGYSTMQYNRNSPTDLGVKGSQHAVAIHLSADKAKALKGAKILGIRTAYATRNVNSFKIFASESLGNANSQAQEQAIADRPFILSDYFFQTPIRIMGEELYVGYEVEGKESNRPVCYFDGSLDYPTGTLWGWTDGAWTDISQTNLGAPVLQLIMEDMPTAYEDAVVKNAYCDGHSHFRIGQSYAFNCDVHNLGNQPIHSLTLRVELSGSFSQEANITGLNIQPHTEATVATPNIVPLVAGMKDWKVTVLSVNGSDDADPTDNTYTSQVYVQPEDMKRGLLIEKHTGQECHWCPGGDVQIDRFIETHDNAIAVTHHTYLSGDQFTMSESHDYAKFFGFSVYPGASMNRCPVSPTSVVMSDIATTSSTLEHMADIIEARPIQVTMDLSNHFDESSRTGQLTICLHTYEKPSDNTHTLHLWLTQDHMLAPQSGGSSKYDHSHTFRGTLNGKEWGDTITLETGKDWIKTFDYTIPESIPTTFGPYADQIFWPAVPTDMHIVAFVADRTDDPLHNVIHNASTIRVTENGNTSSIATPAVSQQQVNMENGRISISGSNHPCPVFNTAGQMVGTLAEGGSVRLPKGIYVVQTEGGNIKVAVR